MDPAQSRAKDQPRPALGLRPWFALLRRARNLRRFALAMRHERVTVLRRNVPIQLIAEVPGVFRCPVIVPASFRERLAGIKRAPPGHGVLLAAAAVNSVGLRRAVTAIALGDRGEILAVHFLAPHAFWRHSRASWILELDAQTPPPPAGRVRILCPATLIPLV